MGVGAGGRLEGPIPEEDRMLNFGGDLNFSKISKISKISGGLVDKSDDRGNQ